MLRLTAGEHPGSIAIREPAPDGTLNEITYRDLHGDVEALARAMSEWGERPVVGVVGRNSIAWATVYLAAMRAGGVVVPMDRELPVQEMRTILHYSGAGTVFLDSGHLDGFLSTGPHTAPRMVVMNGGPAPGCLSYGYLLDHGRASRAELPDAPDLGSPAAIYYTSGTMGQAKGVVLSQTNLLAVVRGMLQMVRMDANDVFLSVLPMHHTYECTCGFLGALSSGATYHISRGLRYVADDIAASGATIVLAVPLLWEAMYRRILEGIRSVPGGRLKLGFGKALAAAARLLAGDGVRRSIFAPVHAKLGGRIRLMISGGAGIDPDVVRGFVSLGFTFLQGYGLTEASPLVSVNRVGANRIGSVGLPLPEMEVRIDEPDEEGMGEIVVRGPNVMLGYHNDPEETSRVLSADRWLRTGDYGYLDRDGYLFITGRRKNVIVAKNGKNVYPEEIECILNRSGAVLESMVFGRESKTKGEEIWAIVVPDMEKLIAEAEAAGEILTRESVVGRMRREIRRFNSSQPLYKRIESFIVREEELPKTTTRKIRRLEVLREAGLFPEKVFGV
ncbi:long-chain fatty acid--CoA ligase [Candidatus Fermentibacteria bacterium]|nr:long-chain fatty acid--CoA ligase [Candidatus Fermentibacteria bacterium]